MNRDRERKHISSSECEKMIKIYALIFMVFISVNIIFLNNVLAKDIDLFSENSPIVETFNDKIICWNFDDIRITTPYSYVEAKFVPMTENVTKYDGYVGWGFIIGRNETNAYPSPKNLTYTQKNVDRMNNLTSDYRIFLFYHDWNHSSSYNPWNKSISYQRSVLNYTVWTFYNNFGYNLTSFLGMGYNANYNTTVILNERDIMLYT